MRGVESKLKKRTIIGNNKHPSVLKNLTKPNQNNELSHTLNDTCVPVSRCGPNPFHHRHFYYVSTCKWDENLGRNGFPLKRCTLLRPSMCFNSPLPFILPAIHRFVLFFHRFFSSSWKTPSKQIHGASLHRRMHSFLSINKDAAMQGQQ